MPIFKKPDSVAALEEKRIELASRIELAEAAIADAQSVLGGLAERDARRFLGEDVGDLDGDRERAQTAVDDASTEARRLHAIAPELDRRIAEAKQAASEQAVAAATERTRAAVAARDKAIADLYQAPSPERLRKVVASRAKVAEAVAAAADLGCRVNVPAEPIAAGWLHDLADITIGSLPLFAAEGIAAAVARLDVADDFHRAARLVRSVTEDEARGALRLRHAVLEARVRAAKGEYATPEQNAEREAERKIAEAPGLIEATAQRLLGESMPQVRATILEGARADLRESIEVRFVELREAERNRRAAAETNKTIVRAG